VVDAAAAAAAATAAAVAAVAVDGCVGQDRDRSRGCDRSDDEVEQWEFVRCQGAAAGDGEAGEDEGALVPSDCEDLDDAVLSALPVRWQLEGGLGVDAVPRYRYAQE
jgi:hypothetical protein